LKYHEDLSLADEAAVDFTVGFHPDEPSKRCFFAVKSNGSKMPFTFEECVENLLERFILPKKELQQGKQTASA